MNCNLRAKKITSVLLALLMVLTMIPSFIFASVAEGAAVVTPISSSGEWEHMHSSDYSDGRGVNYVSMWVKGLNYYFVQTEDNQQMAFTTELWAMKNDGINWARINSVGFSSASDLNFSASVAWKLLSGQSVNSSPNNAGLPGAFGSGYSNQLSKNLIKWAGTYTFTANGAAVYTPVINVNYTSGPTSASKTTYNTDAEEPIQYTISVCDMRGLKDAVEMAENAIAGGTLTENEIADVQAVLSEITANYVLDGSVYYPQEELDALESAVRTAVSADFTAYVAAMDKVHYIQKSTMYTDEEKATLYDFVANWDNILNKTLHEQAIVDAETEAILAALDALTPENLGAPNTGDNTTTSGAGQFVYAPKSGVSSYPEDDRVYITLNHSKVYMDVSENLSSIGLTWSYNSRFGAKQYVSAPLSANCIGDSIKAGFNGEAQPANYSSYFTNYSQSGFEANANAGVVNTNSNTAGPQSATVTLDGTPVGTTGDDGDKVYLGLYWKFFYSGFAGIGSYTRYSYDSYEPYATTTEYPNFTVVVYDKAPLKAAIDQAADELRRDATNYQEYLDLIAAATDVYDTREVTQAQIDAAIASLQDYKFTYKVDVAASSANGGTVDVALVSGEQVSDGVYSEGAVISVSAAPAPDYVFAGWSDGVKDNPRSITVGDRVDVTAIFRFVSADYTDLNEMIGEFNDLDKSIYTDATIKAVQDLIDSFDFELGKSSQAVVDGYTAALKEAVGNLELQDCDYTDLNNAVENANSIPAQNDGKYTDEAYKAYQDAVQKAQDLIDAGLKKDTAGENQKAIDEAAAALDNAIAALDDPANQNGACDYTQLDQAKENAAKIPAVNDGRYTDAAWEEFQNASDAANAVKDGMYDDDKGANQGVIDTAAADLAGALETLENTRNHVVEVKDENGETIATVVVDKTTDTTFGEIKNDLTLPEDTEDKKYIGWEDENGNLITDDTVITGDMIFKPAYDMVVITPNADTAITVDRVDTEYTYMVGLDAENNTVDAIKAQLENDTMTIIVVRDGIVLTGEELVGTGCIVKCVSKADYSIVYEEATVILYGDVDGDGRIDRTDYSLMIKKNLFDNSAIEDGSVFMIAADIENDGVVDAFDWARLDLQIDGVLQLDQTVKFYK